MSFNLQIIIYFIINLVSLYTVTCFFKTTMKLKEYIPKLYYLITYISYLGINITTFIIAGTPLVNVFIQILLLILLSNLYHGDIKNKILISIFFIAFMVSMELLIVYIFSSIFKINTYSVLTTDSSKILGSVISRVIPLIIVKFFQSYTEGKQDNEPLNLLQAMQILLIPAGSIFVMHALVQVSLFTSSNIQWLIISSIIVLVIVNLFFYYVFDKLKKVEQTKYENNLLKAQAQYYIRQQDNLKSNYDAVRTLKHDLKHQLLYIKNKLEENSEVAINDLKFELDKLIGSIELKELTFYSSNTIINSILNYKLDNAIKRNIKVDVKVGLNNSALVNENLLYIILGNALDNALENYNDKKSSSKKIVVRIYEEHSNLYIKISNPYLRKLTLKNNLPLTHKKDSFMHGIGLKSIKNMVENNNGQLRLSHNNNIFVLEIILFELVKYR